MEKTRIGKVYINVKKLFADYKVDGEKVTQREVAEFVISKGSYKNVITKAIVFRRKITENAKYELTITELCNLCRYLDISVEDFLRKYTKSI